MLIKLGQSYNISLLVTDTNSNRVSNDTPITIIKDIETNKYWNGISWSDTATNIMLSYIDNGVYLYTFNPDKIGTFQISTTSSMYGISKTESIEVYSGDIALYNWVVNNLFTISFADTNNIGSAKVSIFDTNTNLYFDGVSLWGETPIQIPMFSLEQNIYTCGFTPVSVSLYLITITSGDIQQIYNLNVQSTGDNVQPIVVGSSNLFYNDGTDSVVLSENNLPLVGVQISAYDFSTKELVSRTVTNSDGNWSLVLKPSKYLFMFEKDGYTTVSFERTVM